MWARTASVPVLPGSSAAAMSTEAEAAEAGLASQLLLTKAGDLGLIHGIRTFVCATTWRTSFISFHVGW